MSLARVAAAAQTNLILSQLFEFSLDIHWSKVSYAKSKMKITNMDMIWWYKIFFYSETVLPWQRYFHSFPMTRSNMLSGQKRLSWLKRHSEMTTKPCWTVSFTFHHYWSNFLGIPRYSDGSNTASSSAWLTSSRASLRIMWERAVFFQVSVYIHWRCCIFVPFLGDDYQNCNCTTLKVVSHLK